MRIPGAITTKQEARRIDAELALRAALAAATSGIQRMGGPLRPPMSGGLAGRGEAKV